MTKDILKRQGKEKTTLSKKTAKVSEPQSFHLIMKGNIFEGKFISK